MRLSAGSEERVCGTLSLLVEVLFIFSLLPLLVLPVADERAEELWLVCCCCELLLCLSLICWYAAFCACSTLSWECCCGWAGGAALPLGANEDGDEEASDSEAELDPPAG